MSLNSTPSGERIHIGIFGRRNAGKSSLINAITGQELAVVSDTAGTTTDPVSKAMELLQMDPSYAERDLNVGFSGGEKKKAEILQLLMLKPSLAILDETDSGLDVDAVRTVSAGIEEYQKTCKGSLIVITHSTKILEALHVDYTHVMVEGRIIKTGDASLVEEINENGFGSYETQEQ